MFHAEHLFVPGVDDIPGGLHVVIFLTGDGIFFQQFPVPLKLTFCIVPLCTDFFNAGIVDSQIVLSGGDSRVRDLLPRQGVREISFCLGQPVAFLSPAYVQAGLSQLFTVLEQG